MKKEFIEAGLISSVVGIKGEVKITPWADSPEFLLEFDRIYLENGDQLKITKARVHKNTLVVKIRGCETPEQARLLCNKIIFIKRDDVVLGDGEYFVQDLLDCSIIDAETAKIYGVLVDITKTGANDVYHIKTPAGKILLAPAIKQVVIKKDPDNREIFIRPLEGLFDED